MVCRRCTRQQRAERSFLGFISERPEKSYGKGPDALWATGDLRFLVIECKSGATSVEIHKRDMAQLAHSMAWFEETYGSGCAGKPIMVHLSNRPASDAVAPSGMRIMTQASLEKLKSDVRAVAQSLATNSTWSDPQKVAEQLHFYSLTGSAFAYGYTMTPARGST